MMTRDTVGFLACLADRYTISEDTDLVEKHTSLMLQRLEHTWRIIRLDPNDLDGRLQ